jgi:molybdenum cofactor biosynthesis protein MoaC
MAAAIDKGAFFAQSYFHMTDVSAKTPTFRRAVAMGRIYTGPAALDLITRNGLPKGDALKLAEMAGIQGAKNASAAIPLCHPLPLDHVALHLELEPTAAAVAAYCTVAATARTGVEMEALAGVHAALLTVYDLVKPVEPALEISGIRLLLKQGGKKGLWVHPGGIPDSLHQLLAGQTPHAPLAGVTAAVLTLSDRASAGIYKDASGELLTALLREAGADITHYSVLPDEPDALATEVTRLAAAGTRLLICTGGTGLTARDITPDTVQPLLERLIPGIGELLRSSGARQLPQAWLSRALAGSIGGMLVITLPGSRGAVEDGMAALLPVLPHALQLLDGAAPTPSRRHAHEAVEPA